MALIRPCLISNKYFNMDEHMIAVARGCSPDRTRTGESDDGSNASNLTRFCSTDDECIVQMNTGNSNEAETDLFVLLRIQHVAAACTQTLVVSSAEMAYHVQEKLVMGGTYILLHNNKYATAGSYRGGV